MIRLQYLYDPSPRHDPSPKSRRKGGGAVFDEISRHGHTADYNDIS